MQSYFLDRELKYDGSQLQGHFAYRQASILGDSCVAFVGPCEVDLDALVDLEDVKKKAPIFSHQMLHFIMESFVFDLKAMVLFQRLSIVILQEAIEAQTGLQLKRLGDDLYSGDKKLSVSIATVSPVSSLIHLGVNISSKDTPVPTLGLKDMGINVLDLAKSCLEAFKSEYMDVLRATYKVRGVP